MTPTNKRNLMLATSGLMGLAGLASLTLGVTEANAACVLQSGVLVCDTSDGSTDSTTEIETQIALQPGPDISVRVQGSLPVDITTGALDIDAPQFKGVVIFNNTTALGKADPGDSKYAAANAIALDIDGDPAAATNTFTGTFDAVVNGSIDIANVGGAVTLNVNKDVRATAAGAGGTITVTNGLGGVTLTQSVDAVINGAVALDAKGVLTAGAPVINGTQTTTTSTTTGGSVTVTLNNDVGHTTKGAGFNTNTGNPNPDVFTAKAVTVDATTGATVNQNAGRIGALTVNSNAGKVVVVDDAFSGGGLNTTSQVTTTSGMGGNINFTQVKGATQSDNATLTTNGNITIDVSGTYAASAAGTKNLTATAGSQATVVTTDVVVDDGAVTTSDLFSTKTTPSSSKITFTAQAGSVAGAATAPSAINLNAPGGVTATVAGTTGRIAINATAAETLNSDANTYEPGVGNGKLLTNTQIDSSKNLKSAVTLTVAGTGVVSSAVATDSTIAAGGPITVDVQTGGRLNGLVVNGTAGAADFTSSVVTTFDKTGPQVSQVSDFTNTDTGGDISLTFNGNSAGSPLTGSTPNNVDATGHGDITMTVGKSVIVGNTTLISTGFDSQQKITDLTPLSGNTSLTDNFSQSASGGAVTFTAGASSVVGDQTGNALVISTQKNTKVTLDGTVRGNVVVNAAPNFITTLDNNLDSVTTTTPAANVTVVTTIDNQTLKQQTIGGSATVANNSLKSILGNLTVTALGDVTLTHPGLTTGNVFLASQGTSFDGVSTSTSITREDPVGALPLTDAKVVTDTVDEDYTVVTAATGGNVSGDYSGIVGLENASPPLVGGTAVTQIADKNSTATVSGTLFTDLNSTAGAGTTTDTGTFDSVLVKNYDKNNPGSLLLMSSGSGSTTETQKVSTVSNLGTSTVTVTATGSLKQDVAGGVSDLNSTGQGGSTVSVAGTVHGSVSSTANANNTTFDYSLTDTKRFVAATTSALAEIGTQNSKRVESESSTSTVVGGASTVSITGKATLVTPTVGGTVNSTGNTTSTVTIGGDALVAGNVNSTVQGQDTGDTYDLTSTRGATGTWTHTEKWTSKDNVSKVSGASSVTVAAPTQSTIPTGVNGNVAVNSDTGAATATIANRVGNDVDVTAVGSNFSDTENRTTTSTSQFGGKTNSAYDYSSTFQEVGGKASATVSSPAALAALNQPVVGDDIRVRGSSATIDIAAGAVVGNGGAVVNTNSVLETETFKQVDTFTTGALATRTITTTETFTGGASTNNIAGEVSGNSTAFGQTATVNVAATGTVGALGGGGNVTADALFENFQRVDSQTGLAAGPVGFTKTITDTFTPVSGGVALVDIKGVVAGNAHAEGATATINNSATSYLGSATVGGTVNNYVQTTTNTPTSSTSTVKANALAVQNSTVNQNGIVEDGIFAFSGFINSPVDGSLIQTSDQKATFNLNTGSTTMGYIGGAYNAITNQLFTTTNVNLNGTGFVGWDGVNKADVKTNAGYNVFNSAPTLTKQQASFAGGADVGSIEGFTTLTHTGPGTFFILGPEHFDNNTASRNDDVFAIRGTTFNNASGRLEFATEDDLFFNGADDVFAIMSKTTNSGEFVLGRTVALVPANNIGSLLNTQTAIQGQHFLHVGDFTQTAAGSLIIGGTPDLMRVGDIGLVGSGAPEPLGFFQFGIGAGPFTLASNSGAPLTDSSMRVEGNLNLAGKIVVANQRGGLQNDGLVTKLFTVTGTVTNTATVAPLFSSNFVTYEVSTSKVGNETILSVNTKRNSFGTVALNDNALAVAGALDSAVPTVIDMITKDANGLPVFSTVLQFNQVQDLAKIIAGFDWTLGLPDVSQALNEMASGDIYSSLNGIDPLAQFNQATMMNGMGLMEGGGRLWAQPAYRTVTIDGDSKTGAGEVKSSEAGLFFGGSFQPTESWNWGVAFGYQGSEVDGEEKPYSAEVNSYLVGANVGWRSGPIRIGGGLNYAASNIEARRSLTILARDITADYDSHSVGIDLHGSYDFEDVLGGTVTPYLRVNFRNVSTDGFTESNSGGGVALTVDKFSETFTTPELGVFWSRNEWDAGFATINPYVGLSILFNSFENETTQRLAGGGNSFVIKGVDPSTSAQLSAGFSGGVGDMGSFSLGLTGQFGDQQGVGANATFRLHFD